MIHPAYCMGGCSGRILTFAYTETFHFSVAFKPLHFVWWSTQGCTGTPILEGISLSWSWPSRGSSLPGCIMGQKWEEKLLTDRLKDGFRPSAPAPSKAGTELPSRGWLGIWYLQGKKISVLLLGQNQSVAKGSAMNRTESWVLLLGRKRSWATRQLSLFTLGLLPLNWIYFGSCRVRAGSTPGERWAIFPGLGAASCTLPPRLLSAVLHGASGTRLH